MQTATDVKIVNGTYRNLEIKDAVFPLVKDYKEGKNGNFITVDGSAVTGFPDRSIRIKVVSKDDFEMLEDGESVDSTEAAKVETDDQIIERLRERFSILEDMTYAACDGVVRGMVVTGPPGVGKSFGVEQVLEKYNTLSTLGNTAPKYEVVKGAMSPIGLYSKLYNFANKDNVLVFDDCDSILLDDLSLNILKAALDSKKVRRICWNTDSHMLRREGVPNAFEFAGSVIFITNIKFDNVKSKKLRDHLEALESRCHYIDLTIDTLREKLLRIDQIVKDGMLSSYAFSPEVHAAIVQWIKDHARRLREVSLRTVLKVSDLAKAFPDTWQAMATNTVLRPV